MVLLTKWSKKGIMLTYFSPQIIEENRSIDFINKVMEDT